MNSNNQSYASPGLVLFSFVLVMTLLLFVVSNVNSHIQDLQRRIAVLEQKQK